MSFLPQVTDPKVILTVAGLLSCSAGINFGYNTGIIANVGEMIKEKYDLTSSEEGLSTATILIGAIIGAMSVGSVADKYGRRIPIQACGLICLVTCILLAVENSFAFFCIIRGFLGLSVGIASVIIPTYVAELSPENIRGQMGTIFQLSICCGIFIAYLTGLGFCELDAPDDCYADDKENYRYQLGFGAIPGVFILLTIALLPESDAFLKKVNSGSQALDPLLTNAQSGSKKQSLVDDYAPLFQKKHELYIGILLAACNQLTGINAIIYYAPKIFEDAGVEESVLATTFVGFWNFVSVIVSLYLVDRIGRRPLLLTGLLMMIVANAGMSIAFYALDDSKAGLAIPSLGLFIFGFEIGPGPLFFVILSELYDDELRAKATSFMNFIQWMLNLLLTITFPLLIDGIGPSATFLIFCLIGVPCITYMWKELKETRSFGAKDMAM
eukprot:TRINITY_DN2843_c0_g1_i1.p1 TRINITY_DN2843_c0_g1~~TRINITY_DN2843_c0_g1_i1.p1  ORF type:complete len:441 (+),score=110.14 TRINITY_DN2843_c0_g1_i1:45-1367(+)